MNRTGAAHYGPLGARRGSGHKKCDSFGERRWSRCCCCCSRRISTIHSVRPAIYSTVDKKRQLFQLVIPTPELCYRRGPAFSPLFLYVLQNRACVPRKKTSAAKKEEGNRRLSEDENGGGVGFFCTGLLGGKRGEKIEKEADRAQDILLPLPLKDPNDLWPAANKFEISPQDKYDRGRREEEAGAIWGENLTASCLEK